MGHPAHFHLFKNTITTLKAKEHIVYVLIKKKDILEDLLVRSGIEYNNILPEGRADSKAAMAWGIMKRDLRLFKFCLRYRPDLMLGTSIEIGHVGTLLRIPTINVNEDDADVVPLYARLSYPWCTHILSPRVCNNGKWEYKSIKYDGYHELAYLHPEVFIPSKSIAEKYVTTEKPYYLMRFAKLNAHHDKGIRGISNELASEILAVLEKKGKVYITSERELPGKFDKYRLKIDPLDIHHVMAYASLYIGDSQTMAAEAGVLGVPFIRYNDFVGRIGYLKDMEETYKLGFGINAGDHKKFFRVITKIMDHKDYKISLKNNHSKMLIEKINVTDFIIKIIEDYLM